MRTKLLLLFALIVGLSSTILEAQYCKIQMHEAFDERDSTITNLIFESNRQSLIVNIKGKQRLFYLTYEWQYTETRRQRIRMNLELPREFYVKLKMYGTKKVQLAMEFENGQTIYPMVNSSADNIILNENFAHLDVDFTREYPVLLDQKLKAIQCMSGRTVFHFDVFSDVLNDDLECMENEINNQLSNMKFSESKKVLVSSDNKIANARMALIGVWGVLSGQNQEMLNLQLFHEYLVFKENGTFMHVSPNHVNKGDWYIEAGGGLVLSSTTAMSSDENQLSFIVQCPNLVFDNLGLTTSACSAQIGELKQLTLYKLRDLTE